MNFIGPGPHGVLAVKGAMPSRSEQLRVFGALDLVAGYREGVSSSAITVTLPGVAGAVDIPCPAVSSGSPQRLSRNIRQNWECVVFPAACAVRSIPKKRGHGAGGQDNDCPHRKGSKGKHQPFLRGFRVARMLFVTR